MIRHKLLILLLVSFFLFALGSKKKVLAQSLPSLLGNCGGPTAQSPVPEVIVSWGYLFGIEDYWSTVETARGQFNWGPLDAFVNSAPSNKKLWLQIVTNTASCGAPSIPDWAIAAGVHQFPDKYDPGKFCKTRPVQWDPKYLEFLEEALKAMGQRYDSNPKIEAYLMMSGGDWGEMALPYKQCFVDARDPNNIYVKEMARVYEQPVDKITGSCNEWEFCFDYYYFESVKKIIDMYARSFSKPVVLQLGSGLSCRGTVAEKAAEYAANTYGPKVWLKQNGWGNSTSGFYFSIFSKYKNKTRIIEEAGHMENVCSKELQWKGCAPNTNCCKCKDESQSQNCCSCSFNTQQEAINWADYLVGQSIGNAGVSAICFYGDVLGSNTSAPQNQQKYPIQWRTLYDGLAKNYNDLYLKQPTLPPPTPSCTQKTTGFTISDFIIWKNEFLNPSTPLHADYNCRNGTNIADFEILRYSLTHQ